MAKGYQRHSRGGSFKKQDFGDLGLRSLDEQEQRIIDSLKLQASRSKEYGSQRLSYVKGIGATEQENREEIQRLETKLWQTAQDNRKTRADNEIDALLGQAKEAGLSADFWSDFSTTYSKQWGQLAQGLRDYADHRYAVDLSKDEEHIERRSKYTELAEGMEGVLGNKMDKSVAKNPDAYTGKKTNQTLLSSSSAHGKQESVFFNNNIESIRDVFFYKIQGITDPKDVRTIGEDYIIDYLKAVGVHPDSRGGRKIINRWTQKVLDESNDLFETQEAGRDKEVLIGLFQRMSDDPSEKNWHRAVQHVRRMYDETENGISKPENNAPRNIFESWARAAQLYYHYAPKDDPIRTNYDLFIDRVTNMRILKADGTGIQSEEMFNVKHAGRLEAELFVPWIRNYATMIDNERKADQAENVDAPLAELKKEVAEKGEENTIQNKEWVMQAEKKFNNNKAGLKAFYDWYGYDREKHLPFHEHVEFEENIYNPTAVGIQRNLWLLSRREVSHDTAYSYRNYDLIAEDLQQLLESGIHNDPTSKNWARNLVAKYNNSVNLDKGFSNNAEVTIQKLNAYRIQKFNELKKEDFTSAYARRKAAQELAEAEFDRGKPKGEGNEWGEGFFAHRTPASSNQTSFEGNMTAEWKVGGSLETTVADKSFEDMSFVYQNREGVAPVDSWIKNGNIISKSQGIGIVDQVTRGVWKGEIPQNVSNLAALMGWDKQETMNYVLTKLGFKTKIPVDSRTYLKKTGVVPYSDHKFKRNENEVLMWHAYVRHLGRFPEAGPIKNSNFIQFSNEVDMKRLMIENQQAAILGMFNPQTGMLSEVPDVKFGELSDDRVTSTFLRHIPKSWTGPNFHLPLSGRTLDKTWTGPEYTKDKEVY